MVDGREKKAAIMASYQGEIKIPSRDYKDLNYEFMSKTAHSYQGNMKMKTKSQKDKYYQELSGRNQQIIGNYRLKYKFVKDIEHQIISARVHGYQGGHKSGLVKRTWLKWFDKEGYKKDKNVDKKPKYDTKESEIWYE